MISVAMVLSSSGILLLVLLVLRRLLLLRLLRLRLLLVVLLLLCLMVDGSLSPVSISVCCRGLRWHNWPLLLWLLLLLRLRITPLLLHHARVLLLHLATIVVGLLHGSSMFSSTSS